MRYNKLKNIIASTIKEHLNENKYSNPEYRRAMDIFEVPTSFIWQYREFDRCGEDNLYGVGYIEALEQDIKQNGIKTPIKLQVDDGKALVHEGNHRLCIAIKLGIPLMLVQVEYMPFGPINRHKAKPINYDRDKWRAGVWD